jgi:glycosyltransferase involved in cell wall biosynthesis
MKILFLSAYFSPESVAGSHLANNRNEAFAEAGFEMEVYTPLPSRGISNEVRSLYKRKRIEKLYGGRMTVHRFLMFREGKNSTMRALRYVLCGFIQFFKGWFAKDIDIVLVVSTPPIQGAIAAMVKKVKSIPFVYCLQDIFPDSLVGTGLTKRGSLLWRIGRVIENFTYNNADKIIVISQDFRRNILAKGVPEEKIVVIYNWVDENVVKNISREENKLFNRYDLDREKFYITYCGNIGLTQNMDMLLEVARELEHIDDIKFVLVGEGTYKTTVEDLIAKSNINNVTLLPFQPYEDISYVFSLGDVGLVISKPGVGENSVPSKMWSIMSAEQTVLASFDCNELKNIIEDNNCGIFTQAGDEEAFKSAILKLYNNREQCRVLGHNGRDFILKNLTREKSTSKYVEVIKQFTN